MLNRTSVEGGVASSSIDQQSEERAAEKEAQLPVVRAKIEERIQTLVDLQNIPKSNTNTNAQQEIKEGIMEHRGSVIKLLPKVAFSREDIFGFIKQAFQVESVLRFKFLPTKVFAFETQSTGWHMFSAQGEELTKDAQGAAYSCYVNPQGDYQYSDDSGQHAFTAQGQSIEQGDFSNCREWMPE